MIAVISTITNINESKIYGPPGNLITSQNVSEVPSDGRYLTTIFPNPNNGITTIKYLLLPSETKGEVLFYNLDGRLVKTFKVVGSIGHIQIDNSDLPSGTYLYLIRSDMNTSETKKMIINRQRYSVLKVNSKSKSS